MILRAAREHSLDLSQSILIGDKISDIEAGSAAGLGCCVLVLSGHAPDRKDLKKVDIVFEDLPAVVDAIVKNQLCLNDTEKKSANWGQH